MTPSWIIERAFASRGMAPEMTVIHPAQPDGDADRLLSPDEAVNFLGRGIEKRTLANWRAQRRGPRAVRVGRSPAYPLREMRRYSRWLQAGAPEPYAAFETSGVEFAHT